MDLSMGSPRTGNVRPPGPSRRFTVRGKTTRRRRRRRMHTGRLPSPPRRPVGARKRARGGEKEGNEDGGWSFLHRVGDVRPSCDGVCRFFHGPWPRKSAARGTKATRRRTEERNARVRSAPSCARKRPRTERSFRNGTRERSPCDFGLKMAARRTGSDVLARSELSSTSTTSVRRPTASGGRVAGYGPSP